MRDGANLGNQRGAHRSGRELVGRVPTGINAFFSDIWGGGPGDIWAVGAEYGSSSLVVVHSDRATWRRVSPGCGDRAPASTVPTQQLLDRQIPYVRGTASPDLGVLGDRPGDRDGGRLVARCNESWAVGARAPFLSRRSAGLARVRQAGSARSGPWEMSLGSSPGLGRPTASPTNSSARNSPPCGAPGRRTSARRRGGVSHRRRGTRARRPGSRSSAQRLSSRKNS